MNTETDKCKTCRFYVEPDQITRRTLDKAGREVLNIEYIGARCSRYPKHEPVNAYHWCGEYRKKLEG